MPGASSTGGETSASAPTAAFWHVPAKLRDWQGWGIFWSCFLIWALFVSTFWQKCIFKLLVFKNISKPSLFLFLAGRTCSASEVRVTWSHFTSWLPRNEVNDSYSHSQLENFCVFILRFCFSLFLRMHLHDIFNWFFSCFTLSSKQTLFSILLPWIFRQPLMQYIILSNCVVHLIETKSTVVILREYVFCKWILFHCN